MMSTCGSSSLDRLSGLKLSTLSMRPERSRGVRYNGVQIETPLLCKSLHLVSLPPRPYIVQPSCLLLAHPTQGLCMHGLPLGAPFSSSIAASLPAPFQSLSPPGRLPCPLSPLSQSDHSSGNGLSPVPLRVIRVQAWLPCCIVSTWGQSQLAQQALARGRADGR